MTFVNEKTEDGTWLTIDKEKKIRLIMSRAPDPEYGYEFELSFDGQIVKFSSYSGEKVHGEPKIGEPRQYDMDWLIYKIFIPQPLQEQKPSIFSVIEESLSVWGWNYNAQNVYSVSVQFSPNLI